MPGETCAASWISAIRGSVAARLRTGRVPRPGRVRARAHRVNPAVLMAIQTDMTDIRLAARSLRKAAGFTCLAVLILAVGIGATSIIFSLIDATMLRPLPYRNPAQLVALWEHPPGYARERVSPLNFLDWSEQSRAFESMAGVVPISRVLTTASGAAERIPAHIVTSAFFDVLGVRPIAGRTFAPDDTVLQPNVVVVSESFWRSRLGSDPRAIGRVVRLDGLPFTLIGIVPAGFQIVSPTDIWTPLPRSPGQRRPRFLRVIARLKAGRTIDDARADMAIVADRIAQAAPDTNRNWGVVVDPLRESLVGGDLRATSLVLGGVVMFVLLMACANVANLLLARGVGRAREIAVRRALGAGAAQILRWLLTESVLLSTTGGCAGIAASWIVIRLMPSIVPPGLLPPGIGMQFDARVALVTAVLSGLAGVLAAAAPAWHATRTPPTDLLAAGGRASTRSGRTRQALAVAEIAGAVLLMSAAGLMIRTLVAMSTEDHGFRGGSVLTTGVEIPISRYNPQQLTAFYRQTEAALMALPGVRSVGFARDLPLQGSALGQPFEISGVPPVDASSRQSAHYQMVNVRYFETLGIAFLKGRPFSDRDLSTSAPVCIVNEEFVRRQLRGREPIGAVVKVPNVLAGAAPPTMAREVVGVIKQVTVQAGERDKAMELYVPLEQNAWYSMAVAIRVDGLPMALADQVRAAIARLDRDLPLSRMRTMDDVAADSVMRPRFRAGLVGGLAGLALALAAVGVFGVRMFSVRERTRELGVRMALGARTADILSLVVGSGAKMAAAGVAIGLMLAAVLTRSLASLLYGVTPLDPVAFVGASATLVMTALLACVTPALLALRTDVAVTLRQE
jgi:putative ABC transport system permease protein